MSAKLPPPFIVGGSYFDRRGEYVVVSVDHDEILFRRPDGSEQKGNARIKANIHRSILTELQASRSSSKLRVAGMNGRPTKGGILEEMFWCIAEVIQQQSELTADYVLHDEITAALMRHEYAGPLLEQRADHDERAPAWFASDYVAFYSKEWTEGRPRHADRLERKRIRGKWAYRVQRP